MEKFGLIMQHVPRGENNLAVLLSRFRSVTRVQGGSVDSEARMLAIAAVTPASADFSTQS